MRELEQKYFRDQTLCQDQSSKFSSSDLSLTVYSFGGLFIITGLASSFSCLIYLVKFHQKHWPVVRADHSESSVWSRVAKMAKHFDSKDTPLHDFKNRTESNARVDVLPINKGNFQDHSTPSGADVDTTSSPIDEQDNHNF